MKAKQNLKHQNNDSYPSTQTLVIWAAFAIALVVRWVAFYYFHFVYDTSDARSYLPISGEAKTYEILARQLILHKSFAPQLFSYRPPLQPIFIALSYILSGTTNPLIPAFAQTFLSAAIAPLAYVIAKRLGASERISRLAAVFTAMDPASIAISLTLEAETLSNIFIALALLFFVLLVKSPGIRASIACSACIALAALARPNALYFAIVVAILIVWIVPQWQAKLGAFLVVFVVAVMPWYLRNYTYNNVFMFSSVGNFNLLFYKAVSVKHWATGEKPTDIEEQLAYEVDKRLGIEKPRETYDYSSKWKFLVSNDAETVSIIRNMAFETYLEFPWTYVMVAPIHLVKLLAFSNLFVSMGDVKWLELFFNIVLYSLAVLGCLLFSKKHMLQWMCVTALPTLYFLLIPLISGGVQDTKARTSITVCLAIMAAYGTVWLLERTRSDGPSHISPR